MFVQEKQPLDHDLVCFACSSFFSPSRIHLITYFILFLFISLAISDLFSFETPLEPLTLNSRPDE